MSELEPEMRAPATPVFVHSLYRSGSTWIFDRFRHATNPYWCYQEPYHEATIWLQTRPDDLLVFDHHTATSLRHPPLDRPYFAEVHALRERLAPLFHKCISFDSFFDTSACPAFHAYTRALIEEAPQRPMLQCCRSFGRVRQIRSEHGGVHIHLWREPREQWWSYQINDYFDTANLAILQADHLPAPLQEIAKRVGLQHQRQDSFDGDYTSLLRFPIDATGRYLVFYALWLYSQVNNFDIADCNLSIDALGANPAAVQNAMGRLQELGIDGVDLSQCKVPHSELGSTDQAFFDPIETEVRRLFVECGYAEAAVEAAVERQREAQLAGMVRPDVPTDQGMRGRSAALRYADTLKAARAAEQAASQQNQLLVTQADALRMELNNELATRAALQGELEVARACKDEFEQRAMQAEQHSDKLAQAVASHMELAKSQVLLAQQQVELTQSHARGMRLDADQLAQQIRSVQDQVGQTLERSAAQLATHTNAVAARLDSLAADQAQSKEELIRVITERLASLSSDHEQRLQAERAELHDDLALQVGHVRNDLREAIDRTAAELAARSDEVATRLESLAADQAQGKEEVTRLITERLASLSSEHEQRLQAQCAELHDDLALQVGHVRNDLREAIDRTAAELAARSDTVAAKLEGMAAHHASDMGTLSAAVQRLGESAAEGVREIKSQLTSLTVAMQARDARISELEGHATVVQETMNVLLAFRRDILGTRLGRWLAARKGWSADHDLPKGSSS